MNACWSMNMLPSSSSKSLSAQSSSSRKQGGPAIGNTQLALRSSMYRMVRSTCRERFSAQLHSVLPPECHRPSDTRWRPRTAAGARRTGPSFVNSLRLAGRASFWLSRRTPSCSTHSDESPRGPSFGDVSVWIMMVEPVAEGEGLVGSRTQERRESERTQFVFQLAGRIVGQQHRRRLRHEPA